jgi:hypothetical protein
VVKDWRRVPIILNLERVIDEGGFYNLTKMLVDLYVFLGDYLLGIWLPNLFYFGVDGVIVFQSMNSGVRM